jgi:hypothetical protein
VKYMLLICTDAEPDTNESAGPSIDEWVEEGARTGMRLDGERLRPPADATTIRLRGGELLVTDGPFAETKEWIAGYDVVECANLDEAIDYASRHPMARHGRIEIRPFHLEDD